MTNECCAKLAGVSYDAFSMMRNTGGGRVSTRRRALGDTKKKTEGQKKKKNRRLTKYAEITDDGDDINVC